MKLYTCCPQRECGGFQEALSFLHRWGIEPEIGVDDDGHYFGFEVPSEWVKRRRRAFKGALARQTKPAAENIRLVHEDAIQPDPEYASKNLDWFVGRSVKSAFQSEDGFTEHMWVQITHVEDGTLFGKLDNDPVIVKHIKHGDPVRLTAVQVEMVSLSPDEWRMELEKISAKDDYFNKHLGSPVYGNGIEQLYDEGFTPRLALQRWRNYTPIEV